jgi:hypothetical protein
MIKSLKIGFVLLLFCKITFANDSLSTKESNIKKNLIIGSEAVVYTAGYVGLNYLWYTDFPRSSFHFFNDGNEWLQMDKCGHSYSTYWIARANYKLLQWSGYDDKKAVWGSIASSWLFISTIELFDGFSSEYGASPEDILANTAGVSLFGIQQLLWKEQKLVYKFSYFPSPFAKYRPNELGSTFIERGLKDYNGQTYWLSTGLRTITGIKAIPAWLNVAIGYGADGMTGASNNKGYLPDNKRIRQLYFAFDLNLEKIKTKNKVLKTVFFMFNCLKFPLPAIEINKNGANFRIR